VTEKEDVDNFHCGEQMVGKLKKRRRGKLNEMVIGIKDERPE
jgi:hypothetical protein